ncbi:MAG: DNA replication/repair protein RecF [Nibricoccus sp.]
MRLSRITLENFRNIPLAELTFEGRQHFLLGQNGQGKTNLLEAVGYLTALRSFRTSDQRLLISHGKDAAGVACEIQHELLDETGVMIKLRPDGKEVTCDGEWVTKFGDYLGRFPTVVFSSNDQQLVRGGPAFRRRWLDLTIAAMDTGYLHLVQQYYRAVVDRNRLLKQGASPLEFAAFELPLANAASQIVQKRAANIKVLSGYVAEAYTAIAGEKDQATMRYEPDFDKTDVHAWTQQLQKNRPRDIQLKSTNLGPHRDDCGLLLGSRAARDYGSEGQQRSLALALRLAQVNYFHERSGVQPVVLADDVLGELDPVRRRQFWHAIGADCQVFATGTSLPEAELGRWQVFKVEAGRFIED